MIKSPCQSNAKEEGNREKKNTNAHSHLSLYSIPHHIKAVADNPLHHLPPSTPFFHFNNQQEMISLKPSTHHNGFDTSFPYNSSKFQQNPIPIIRITKPNFSHTKTTFRTHAQPSGSGKGPQKRTFLTIEEAGLVEVSGLSTHERFLCRLTV